MYRMKKIVAIVLLLLVVSLGAPQAFASDDGPSETPGIVASTNTSDGPSETPGFFETVFNLLSTLIP